MSRQTLEDNPTNRPILSSPRYKVVRLALTGAFPIPNDAVSIYELDPNGSDRTVTLPAPQAKGALVIYVKNIGSSGLLNVVDHLGAAVTSIAAGGMSTFISGTSTWHLLSANPLYVPDGTEALPGLSFASDPDTGLYRPSANAIGISAGGVGHILIQKAVDIGGGDNVSLINIAQFEDGTIILGTTATPFWVARKPTVGIQQKSSQGAGVSEAVIIARSNDTVTGASLKFVTTRGTETAPTALSANDMAMEIQAAAYMTTGGFATVALMEAFLGTGTHNANSSCPGYIRFRLGADGTLCTNVVLVLKQPPATTTHYFAVTPGVSNVSNVILAAEAAGAGNVGITLQMAGTGSVVLKDGGGGTMLTVAGGNNIANSITIAGVATGENATITVNAGSLRIGSGSALSASTTIGFLCIPALAGTPTGTPAGTGVGTDQVPICGDTTNTVFYAYMGGTFVAVGPAPQHSILLNASFQINQRQATSVADDTYCLDGWYVLTESGNVTVAQQSDQENNQKYNIRLTQPDASAKRLGIASIVEGKDCRHLRGKKVTFKPRIRCSSSQAIRFAIIEWTGTEDSVISDIVNNWSSGTFTAGNFFTSTSMTIAGVGTVTPSANTWTSPTPLTVTISGSLTNLLVFVWSEGTLAQNETLDIASAMVFPAGFAPELLVRSFQEEMDRCQRYYEKTYAHGTAPGTATVAGYRYIAVGTATTAQLAMTWNYQVEKRTTPTVTIYAPNDGASGNVTRASSSVTGFTTGANATSVLIGTNDATSTQSWSFHATADCSL